MSYILTDACADGDLPLVAQSLIGLSIEEVEASRAEWYSAPLVAACKNGHRDVVRLLLHIGCNPNKHTSIAESPLLSAVCNNRVDVVEMLLESGAYPDFDRVANFLPTPMIVACSHGFVEIVKLLVRKSSINTLEAANEDGATPLYFATQHGHTEVVEYLLRNCKLNADKARKDGSRPLFIATQQGHTAIVKLLLEFGHVDVDKPRPFDGSTPLLMAVLKKNIEITSLLLCAGADPCSKTWGGMTPIHAACLTGNLRAVRMLIKHSCAKALDFEALGIGATPLLVACRAGRVDVVRYLIKKGADIKKHTTRGETPLSAAINEKQPICLSGHPFVTVEAKTDWSVLYPTTSGYICYFCGTPQPQPSFPAKLCQQCAITLCPVCFRLWMATSSPHYEISRLLQQHTNEQTNK